VPWSLGLYVLQLSAERDRKAEEDLTEEKISESVSDNRYRVGFVFIL
jgi:hypothetical protein